MHDDAPGELHALLARTSLCRDYPQSAATVAATAFWLERMGDEKRLAVAFTPGDRVAERFHGADQALGSGMALKLCPTDTANAAALRDTLPWLRPVVLGLGPSAGFGDRLGLATPGHVRALHHISTGSREESPAPIFAQQSIREMTRTGRSPHDVLRDATWGAFEAGWRGPVGADADHLKTPADIDATLEAGYTFFTLDPSAYVDPEADHAPPARLRQKVADLPWGEIECTLDDLRQRYEDRRIDLETRSLTIDGETLARAAAKYGGAVAHVARLYRHLAGTGKAFEVEISVDETESPTSVAEHIYLTGELRRLGVRWVSLAPRFVGRFEKGVDYIGDLDAFQAHIAGHAEIARVFGPYKLSLHSGSDKFSIYPIARDATAGLLHLKTAGTSYLEALRVTAELNPSLFRQFLALGRARYLQDRASYHVSAELSRAPEPEAVADATLGGLLDDFDVRQVLHVTFGSALAAYGPALLAFLRLHASAYSAALETHFVRHLAPLFRPAVPTEVHPC